MTLAVHLADASYGWVYVVVGWSLTGVDEVHSPDEKLSQVGNASERRAVPYLCVVQVLVVLLSNTWSVVRSLRYCPKRA